MNELASERVDYWQDYYSRDLVVKRTPPSQFASFVAQEAENFGNIVDVGCGNGRDSIFLAEYGFRVIGIDGSQSAVDLSTKTASLYNLENVSFVQSDIRSNTLMDILKGAENRQKICVYSRFFLHAITQEEEDHFVDALGKSTIVGDMVAFEFRTPEDENIEKVMEAHYRRFVKPAELNVSMRDVGFTLEYETQGTGYAKFRSEDAYVARVIYTKKDV